MKLRRRNMPRRARRMQTQTPLHPFHVQSLEPRTLLSVQPAWPEVRANTTTAGDQQTLTDYKAVASNANGDSVVIWESTQFGPAGQLFGQRLNAAGVKQGGEFLITPFTHHGQYYASVAMDAAGGFVVVWDNQSAVFRGIYSQRYSPQGVAQGGATLVAADGQAASVAVDPDGDYVVAWEQTAPGDRDIVAQRFDAAGVALGGPFFAQSNSANFQNNPAVAMDANGNFLITWIDVVDIVFVKRIRGRLFDSAGNARTGDLDLVPATPGNVRWGQHRVAMDANGDFTVVWDALGWAPDTDGYGVYARRFAAGGAPISGDILVNTTTAGSQNAPDVSMDAAGDFIVSWVGAGSSGVTGQYFDPAGNRVGGEFRIDTPATRGWFASVAMDFDGDFTAAWQSSQAAGDDDVYVRRFVNTKNLPNVVSGQVFKDVNADGARDAGDPALPNWQVYRDANNNGQLDTTTLVFPSRAVLTPIRPVSTRRVLGPAANFGVGQVIRDVNVTINIQHPTDGDLTVTLISPSGRRAELFSHIGGTGDNFTNTTLDDASPIAINGFVPPFTGTFRTQNQTLSVFNGEVLGDDGYWMLEVNNSGGDSGNIFAWTVQVTYDENSTTSDAAGNYALPVPLGPSTVRPVQQVGWTTTYPPGGAQSVDFADGGQSAAGRDFGIAYAGTATGIVFDDTNENQVRDRREPLLEGWTVYADLNDNHQLDPGEPSTITPAGSVYTLRGLPFDATYPLRAFPPQPADPWALTIAPVPLRLDAFNQIATNQNFGEVRRLNPQVTQVFVNGTGLTTNAAFRGAAGADATYGYPVPAGAAQLRSIPWSNGISAVSLRFSQDVASLLAQGDLHVTDPNGAVATSGFAYEPTTHTATWTLGSAVTRNKLRLYIHEADLAGLDGEWANGLDAYPSGDGTPGGDFNFGLNILRGDANGDGVVNALDLADAKRRLTRRAGDGVTGTAAYSIFADINMDGVINAIDLAAVKARLTNRIDNLPPPVFL